MVIDQAAKLTDDIAVRFAALCHDLGKGTTPTDVLPHHYEHELRSKNLSKILCKRLRVPNDIESLTLKVAEYHTHIHLLFELKSSTILKVIEAFDSFRKPERFEQFLLAGEADSRGRTGYEDKEVPEINAFKQCLAAAQTITAKPFVEQGLQGPKIAEAMRQQRIKAIDNVMKAYKV